MLGGGAKRNLLNTQAPISDREAGLSSLGGARADTAIVYGRRMLTMLGGLAARAVIYACGNE